MYGTRSLLDRVPIPITRRIICWDAPTPSTSSTKSFSTSTISVIRQRLDKLPYENIRSLVQCTRSFSSNTPSLKEIDTSNPLVTSFLQKNKPIDYRNVPYVPLGNVFNYNPYISSSSSLFIRRNSNLRSFSSWRQKEKADSIDNMGWYVAGTVLMAFSVVWIAVPLYRMFCQQSGQGQAQHNVKEYNLPSESNYTNPKKLIRVKFESSVHRDLKWKVDSQQKQLVVAPGETALAFYRAKNNLKVPVIGTSVYHIEPAEAGLYFNKIQCFCFDEQLLNPAEEVDLPILFYLEPEMADDHRFQYIEEITLNYIFFESNSDIPEEYQELLELREFEKQRRQLGSDAAPPVPAAPRAIPGLSESPNTNRLLGQDS